VIDLVVLVLIVVHELLQLFTEQVNFSEVERAKICEERLIDQVVVNAEVEGMLAGLGWVLITDPVEPPWDDLYGCVGVRVALSRSSSFVVWLHHFLVFSRVVKVWVEGGT